MPLLFDPRIVFMPVMIGLALSSCSVLRGDSPAQTTPENFRTENLVAWCIVPFDAEKRGPAERVEMLQRLGLNRVAYDWRAEHVSQFEQEIQLYKKNDIEFFAFWSWHDSLEPLIKRYEFAPQIWYSCPSPEGQTQADKVAAAAKLLIPMVKKTESLGLKLGLYNHGGWGGDPENMVAVCESLRQHHDAGHVGIVYNFHHGHEHVDGFDESFERMKPYLLCLNLNGLVDPRTADITKLENKIRPIGSGLYEAEMIQGVIDRGYKGSVGILDHRHDLDSEVALRANLEGLRRVIGGR